MSITRESGQFGRVLDPLDEETDNFIREIRVNGEREELSSNSDEIRLSPVTLSLFKLMEATNYALSALEIEHIEVLPGGLDAQQVGSMIRARVQYSCRRRSVVHSDVKSFVGPKYTHAKYSCSGFKMCHYRNSLLGSMTQSVVDGDLLIQNESMLIGMPEGTKEDRGERTTLNPNPGVIIGVYISRFIGVLSPRYSTQIREESLSTLRARFANLDPITALDEKCYILDFPYASAVNSVAFARLTSEDVKVTSLFPVVSVDGSANHYDALPDVLFFEIDISYEVVEDKGIAEVRFMNHCPERDTAASTRVRVFTLQDTCRGYRVLFERVFALIEETTKQRSRFQAIHGVGIAAVVMDAYAKLYFGSVEQSTLLGGIERSLKIDRRDFEAHRSLHVSQSSSRPAGDLLQAEKIWPCQPAVECFEFDDAGCDDTEYDDTGCGNTEYDDTEFDYAEYEETRKASREAAEFVKSMRQMISFGHDFPHCPPSAVHPDNRAQPRSRSQSPRAFAAPIRVGPDAAAKLSQDAEKENAEAELLEAQLRRLKAEKALEDFRNENRRALGGPMGPNKRARCPLSSTGTF
ncbi:hypothetical protein N7539_008425 [Penicillium diatomitis]|uniref:Uncharacterized protein n=1 Tax=Penicillium diatomitis TaxID=2819901 RepID=A0A9W9WTS1_9EURO|nr:uncharacterized protein N7539_008425 [Penicillium diatomitis]KAJ5475359.1 hypothetical protein N7539_008425 [Penicillium diatomitis]